MWQTQRCSEESCKNQKIKRSKEIWINGLIKPTIVKKKIDNQPKIENKQGYNIELIKII